MAGRPIDEQIVKMTLDEADFRKKAENTISIFEKMGSVFGKTSKNAPTFDKSIQSLEELNYISGNTTMDKLLGALDTVTSRFSVMGEVANRILTNIAMNAINTGTQLIKSLSVDQIMAGFREYELKIGSIQTILSNTAHAGTNLEQVNKALDELNLYADRTIYNFADMTQNIGRFTTAGVGLEDSVTAIKGLSNLAAVSGSNTNQAANAMYQLSQELANGRVTLQGWNSVVNAGMGGKKFQDALIESGKNIGSMKDETKSFRDSLQDGWLTSEVLLDTLAKFAEDESMLEAATKVRTYTQMMDTLQEAAGSGWARTWELLIGDFETASDLWTQASEALSGVIEGSAEARNKLIEEFIDLGGRDSIVQTIKSLFESGMQISKIAKDAFRDIFPPVTAQQLLNLVDAIKDFTASLTLSEKMAGKVSTIFRGVFSVFSSLWEITKSLGSAMLNILPEGLVSTLGGGFVDILVAAAEALLRFNESLKEGNAITKSLSGIGTFLGSMVTGIVSMFGSIRQFLFGSAESLAGVGETVSGVISSILSSIGEFLGGFTAVDLLNTGLVGVLALAVNKVSKLSEPVKDLLESITGMFKGDGGGGFSKFFKDLGETLSSFTDAVKSVSLMAIAVAVGTLAVSLKLLEGIDAADIMKGISALAVILAGLTTSLGVVSKMDLGIFKSASIATTFIAMAGSIFVIAGALKMLSTVNPEDMSTGLRGLVAIVATMATSMALLSKVDRKGTGGSMQIVAMAGSLIVIAQAVKTLSGIDASGLTRSVTALAVVVSVMAGFVLLTEGTKMKSGTSSTLLSMAVSVKILVSAMTDIANIPTDQLTKSLITIGILLGEIALFSNLMSGIKITGSVGMIAMATTLNLLVRPLEKFASMDGASLSKGLITIAAGLGVMVLAMHGASGGIVGAGAMVVMATALNLMVIPIKALSSLNIQQVGMAMLALAGTIAVMAGASLLLTPALPAMLGLAGTIALVGVGVGLAAAGLAMLATGLVAIAGAAPQVITALEQIIVGIALGLTNAAPVAVEAVFTIIHSLSTAFRDYIPEFVSIAVDIIVKLAQALGEGLPDLLTAAIDLIVNLINGMADAVRNQGPELISAVFNLLGSILELVVTAMVQLVDTIFGWIPGVSDAANSIGDAAIQGIRDRFGTGEVGAEGAKEFADGIVGVSAAGAGTELAEGAAGGMAEPDTEGVGSDKGDEFVRGVSSQALNANSAGRSVSQKGREGASSVSWFQTGASAVSGFVSGIWGNIQSVYSAGVSMAEKALSAVKTRLDSHSPAREMIPEGANFVMGMVEGIRKNTKYAVSEAGNMATRAMTSAKSYVDTFMEVLSEDFETNPVVKPVLDLSDINNNPLDLNSNTRVVGNTSGLMREMMSYISPKKELPEEPKTKPITEEKQPIVINFNNPVVQSVDQVRELSREAMAEVNRTMGSFIAKGKGGMTVG